MNVTKKNINDLKFHPMNEQIYGVNDEINSLKEDIRISGDVMTLVVTSDNVIISGHRRVKACRELVAEGDDRFTEVNCEIRDFPSEEDEISYLIRCNQTREKSREQKARESEKLLEAEKALAAKRQKATQFDTDVVVSTLTPPSDDNKKGKARDIAAEEVGFKSGMELERSIAAVKKIDELTEQGRSDDAQLIRNELNNGTASAAEKLAKHINELSEEDKQNILQNKVSVNKVTSKFRNEAKKDKAKAKAEAIAVTDNVVVENVKTSKTDDPEGLGLIVPEKTDVFNEPINGSTNIEAVLYADPRTLSDFMQTASYISDWSYYTAIRNKENLITFANKAIENAGKADNDGKEYIILRTLINGLQMLIDAVDPIIKDYEQKTNQESRKKEELHKKQDEEGRRAIAKENEKARKKAMEKSRKENKTTKEVEHDKGKSLEPTQNEEVSEG